ncbi:hypothetical protein [Methylorubrum podarium]|jgi:hypothetical protein|uniref:hypothetical protein n=1 Tax=Methylorubrum podarium TaxID=200476 RepID=UPI001EE2AB51|nr:hypothetical protein [Methylorubrum podarium]GJE72722.1 hypothetical protein CHKEEEPN_4281 [Methylorubrum podarium]
MSSGTVPYPVTLDEIAVTGRSWDNFITWQDRYYGNPSYAISPDAAVDGDGLRANLSSIMFRPVKEIWRENDRTPNSAVPIPVSVGKYSGPIKGNTIQEVEFRKDPKGNTYYTLSTGKEEIDITKIAGYQNLGIDPNAASFHKHEIKTFVCLVSNPNCTPDNIHRLMRENPAPFVSYKSGQCVNSGDVSTIIGTGILGVGQIVHYVDPSNFSLVNVTLDNHKLYPGLVYQQVFQDGNALGIRYIGIGNGLEYLGNFGVELSNALQYAWPAQSTEIGLKILKNHTTILPKTWNSLNTQAYPEPVETPISAPISSIYPPGFDGIGYLNQIGHGKTSIPVQKLFDPLAYIASYGDLIEAFGANAAAGQYHYETYGVQEGRHITFDGLRYIASHADLIKAYGGDAASGVLHYLHYGYREGRATTFDPNSYMCINRDVLSYYGNNAEEITQHYIRYGFLEGRDPGNGRPLARPVFLDLDGDGIEIIPYNESSAHFDIMGTGHALKIAWVGKDDGILAIDLGTEGHPHPDGIIDQQYEINFSEALMARNPGFYPKLPTDIEGIKVLYDSNKNGLLDPGDIDWGRFRVWQDRNQDGSTDDGELNTLDEQKISSISLQIQDAFEKESDGSIVSGFSDILFSNGRVNKAGNVQLSLGAVKEI